MILNSLFSKYYHQFGFQDSATSLMEGIVELHAFVCFFLIVISIVVIWLLFQIIENYVLLPNSFTKIKTAHRVSKMDLTIALRVIAISICAYPGLDYRWDYHYFTRKDVLWSRLLTLYIIIKAYQINLKKIFYLVKFQYLNKRNKFVNDKNLEFLWTSIPCLVLIIIALPSFYYLYISEENLDTLLSVKAVGYQWYWTYDYVQLFPVWFNNFIEDAKLDLDDYIIESFMEPTEYLNVDSGISRLLECDNYLLLPINLHLKLIISSIDVLHSFAVPALGLKVDAVPGRLNQLDVFIHRSGVFYGQCSEICGIGHGFMPICLYAISYLNFLLGKC
jgi:heme/copper-type cytochrome/quinol oxidase subunit 2